MANRLNIGFLWYGILAFFAACPGLAATAPVQAKLFADGGDANAVSAVRLARSYRCFGCHGTFNTKKELSYPAIAKRHKDEPDAEARLIRHVVSGEEVTRHFGYKESHRAIRNKSPDELRNLVKWILAE